MIVLLRHFVGWLTGAFQSREDLILENLALRQQLLTLHAKRPRRRLGSLDHVFWVWLRKLWSGWKKRPACGGHELDMGISLLVAGVFAVIDVGFFSANMLKVAAGGWVPLVMGGAVYAVMLIWHKGYEALLKIRQQTGLPLDQVLKEMNTGQLARVPGTAVFLTPSELDVPPVLAWHIMKNRALHETVFILNVSSELVPYVPAEERVTVQDCLQDCSLGFGPLRTEKAMVRHPRKSALKFASRSKIKNRCGWSYPQVWRSCSATQCALGFRVTLR